MADYKDRLEGAPTAVATQVGVLSATSMLIAATQLSRRTVTFIPNVDVSVNYGAAAVNGQNFLMPASSVMNETFYTGPIYIACATGASAVVSVLDVFGN